MKVVLEQVEHSYNKSVSIMESKQQIVTKQYLSEKLEQDPVKLIGRALVAIFNHQTEEEQQANTTTFKNGIGFTGYDGRIGALGAKYYLKHKTLEPWQIKIWTKPDKKGNAKITRYAGQLNRIAIQKLNIQSWKQEI